MTAMPISCCENWLWICVYASTMYKVGVMVFNECRVAVSRQLHLHGMCVY